MKLKTMGIRFFRRFLLYIFFLSLPLILTGQAVRHPRVAVVLSGGGAKGFVHIGVLKVLEQEGIPVDIIVGTSIGSLVGGVYAIGYTASEIEAICKKQNWQQLLLDDLPRAYQSRADRAIQQRYLFALQVSDKRKITIPQGVIRGQNVLNLLCSLAGNVPYNMDFSKLPVSFACVATDLETGKEIDMHSGYLPTAMFGSMAVPGVFNYIERDGRILVDGGVVNNFPVDLAKEMGADIIIGVDITSNFVSRDKIKSLQSMFSQMMGFLDLRKDSVNASMCDILIRPDISGYTLASFNNQAVDTLIVRGMKATLKVKDQLMKIKKEYDLKPHEHSRQYIPPDKWLITNVTLTGKFDADAAFLLRSIDLPTPGYYSSDDIKGVVNQLYGYGIFDKIYFNLDNNEKGKTLNINITEKNTTNQYIGFKVNTTDAAALMFNLTRKNFGKRFGMISASAELSANPGVSFTAETSKGNFPSAGVSLKGKYQNYNIYDEGTKLYRANLFYSSASLYLFKRFLKQNIIGLGLREEYYRGDIFSRSNSTIANFEKNSYLTNAYGYLSVDNLDDYYFPSRGTELYTEYSLQSTPGRNSYISQVFQFRMRNYIPVSQNITILFNLNNRSVFSSRFPAFKVTMAGGAPYSQYFDYNIPFVGLNPVTLVDKFALCGLTGVRVRFHGRHYLSFMVNSLYQSSEVFTSNHDKFYWGGGIDYSIKTILGPIDILAGYSNAVRGPAISANFGYWF
jgi:NTE family protein